MTIKQSTIYKSKTSKVDSICSRIRTIALDCGPDFKLPTTRELCMSLGTTPTTLDSALSHLEKGNVIYRKQRSGIFVSPKINQKKIALVWDTRFSSTIGASPFWGMLSAMLFEEAKRRSEAHIAECGFYITSRSREAYSPLQENLVTLINEGQIDGVIAISLQQSASQWLMMKKIPIVSFGGSGQWFVQIPTSEITRLGVKALAGMGCRRIGSWLYSAAGIDQRQSVIEPEKETEEFRVLLKERGLKFYPQHSVVIPTAEFRDFDPMGKPLAYDLALAHFGKDRSEWPDGVLIYDDTITASVLAAFHKLGIRPDIDVKIVSHANIGSPLLACYADEITMIEVDVRKIATTLFETLDLLLAGEIPPEQYIQIVLRQRVQ